MTVISPNRPATKPAAPASTRAVAALLCGLLITGPGADALAAPAVNAAKKWKPVAVLAVPFVALPGAPEAGAGRLWAQVLAELKTRPELAISEPAADAGDLAFSAARSTADAERTQAQAREQVAKAAELGRKNKPALQATALLKAVSLLLGKPLAVDQQGGALLADATQQMAAARMQSGNDEGGDEALADLVRRAPERTPSGDYPPAFVRAFEAARQRVLSGPRGSLRVLAPAGAPVQVLLDGRPLGTAPVQLVEVPTGVHVVRAERAGEAWAETVTLLAGAELLVQPRPGALAGGPTSELQADLGKGQLDRPAATKAAKLARHAGAQAALVGAVAREQGGLAARSFLVLAKGDRVIPLSAMALDAEMLGASLEVLRLADDLVARLASPPLESPLPLPLGSASAEALEMPSVAAAPPAPEAGAAPVAVSTADLRKAAGVGAGPAAAPAPVAPADAPAPPAAAARAAAREIAPLAAAPADSSRPALGSLAAAVAAAAPAEAPAASEKQPEQLQSAQPQPAPVPEAAPARRMALIPGAKPAAAPVAAPAEKAPVAIDEMKEQPTSGERAVAVPATSAAAPANLTVAAPVVGRAVAVPAPAPAPAAASADPGPARELVIPGRRTRDDRDDDAAASTAAKPRPAPVAATRMEAREASEVAQAREQKPSKSHAALWIVAGVLVAGGLGTGGYFLYQGSRSASSATVSASWRP